MSFQIFTADDDGYYEDDDNVFDEYETELVYNVPDRMEQDPEVIRSEMLFYNTPRTTQWSPFVYKALVNIQNQCYGDYATICDRNMEAFEVLEFEGSPFMMDGIFSSYELSFFDSLAGFPDCFDEVNRRLTVSAEALRARHGMEMINSLRSMYKAPRAGIDATNVKKSLAEVETTERIFTPIVPRHTVPPPKAARALLAEDQDDAQETYIFLPPPGQPQALLMAGDSLSPFDRIAASMFSDTVFMSSEYMMSQPDAVHGMHPMGATGMSPLWYTDEDSKPEPVHGSDYDWDKPWDAPREGPYGKPPPPPAKDGPRGPHGGRAGPSPPPPRREDTYFAGAIGFGADGDQCMYDNAAYLSPQCSGSIQTFYQMREQYWRQDVDVEEAQMGGLPLLLLGGMLLLLVVRRMRMAKRVKEVNSFLSALHADPALRASVENHTGLKVPSKQTTRPCCSGEGASVCGRVVKAVLLMAVVVFFSIVISISSLEITANIVGQMDADRQAVDYNVPPTSPLCALSILLTVCSIEVGLFFLMVRGMRIFVNKWNKQEREYMRAHASNNGSSGNDGHSPTPSAPKVANSASSTSSSSAQSPASRLGAYTTGRIQQWRTYALQTFRPATSSTSNNNALYSPLISSDDMDNSSVHTVAGGAIPMQQLHLVHNGGQSYPSVTSASASAPQYVVVQGSVNGPPQYAQPISHINYV